MAWSTISQCLLFIFGVLIVYSECASVTILSPVPPKDSLQAIIPKYSVGGFTVKVAYDLTDLGENAVLTVEMMDSVSPWGSYANVKTTIDGTTLPLSGELEVKLTYGKSVTDNANTYLVKAWAIDAAGAAGSKPWENAKTQTQYTLCVEPCSYCLRMAQTKQTTCQNNGTCIDIGDNSFKCECLSGFGGWSCGEVVWQYGCKSSPCVRGKCSETAAAYKCECPAGYVGTRCDKFDESRCPDYFDRVNGKCLELTLRAAAAKCTDRKMIVSAAVVKNQVNHELVNRILVRQFNSITARYEMKFYPTALQEDKYDFIPGEVMLGFVANNNMKLRGHCLSWYPVDRRGNVDLEDATRPDWLYLMTDPLKKAASMKKFIFDSVTHYRDYKNSTMSVKGGALIKDWDVVKNVYIDNVSPAQFGKIYTTTGIQLEEGGPILTKLDMIAQLFRWANEADPNLRLFWNDYGIEDSLTDKFATFYEHLQKLVNDGVPIHGVALQYHVTSGDKYPDLATAREAIGAITDLGLTVQFAEMDMAIPVTPTDLDAALKQQGEWYYNHVSSCLKNPKCDMIQTWGVSDAASWLGLQKMPLLLDGGQAKKPAYYRVLDAFAEYCPATTAPNACDYYPCDHGKCNWAKSTKTTFVCECDTPYSGERCDIYPMPCELNNGKGPCEHGTCENESTDKGWAYICTCEPGYTGLECQLAKPGTTPTNNGGSTSPATSSDSSSTPLVIGVVVVAILLLAIGIYIAYSVCRGKQSSNKTFTGYQANEAAKPPPPPMPQL